MEKYQYFNNLKFTRCDKTGYYLNSTIRKRLHRYVWEYYNGEIPKGYEIHHKDLDRSNNDISNLEMLTKKEHCAKHSMLLTDEQREWRRNNLNTKARPKAIEWHKSEKGHLWHKEHYQRTKDVFNSDVSLVCLYCGNEFSAHIGSKYCSAKCKSAHRRLTGVDNEQRICVVCGKAFMTNKYKDAKTCSKTCSGILRHTTD